MGPDWRNYDWEFGSVAGQLRAFVGSETEGLVVGAGALFLRCPVPLVLANARHPGFARYERGVSLLPIEESGPVFELLSGRTNLPPQTVVMLADPPQPMGVPAGRVIEGKMKGTLGPRLAPEPTSPAGIEALSRCAVLTAGHVVGPPGSAVDEVEARRFRSELRRPLGTVISREVPEPFGPPAFDVALVETSLHRMEACRPARCGPFQHQPLPATLYGGQSGRGYGSVIGALDAYSDGEGRMRWQSSWILVPGGLGRPGDSGGSVELPDGSVLGILVGGSKVKGRDDFDLLYVQDLEAVMHRLPV